MKIFLKKILRSRNWALVNTRYKWGIDLYSDIKKVLKHSSLGTVIDVGANEGLFAEEMVDSLSIKKLYAIEPGSSAYHKLTDRFSNSGHVKCDQYAIGEKSGTCVLYTYPDSKKNTLDASMRDQMRVGEGKPEEIIMISLGEYASDREILEVDFLKIDVEGNELSVLKGASQLLLDGKIKLIYCEFHKVLAFENKNSSHTNLGSLVEFLDQFDYRFVSLYTQGVHFHENLVTCNVLFAHKSLFDNF